MEDDTVLRLLTMYPKSVRKLFDAPVATVVEELEKARHDRDWEAVGLLTDFLSFLMKDENPPHK